MQASGLDDMSVNVAVIDYGIGNLFSVQRALEYCEARVKVTSDPVQILSASRVVLPGVGAFADGMAELRARGLDDVVCQVANRGTPLMGVCLGMQLLMDESEEFGLTSGLGLIPGQVVPIPSIAIDGSAQRIPHIGWNELVPPLSGSAWQGTPLVDLDVGAAVYFVHSFMVLPAAEAHRMADCVYGGHRVCAVVGRDNIVGCQFHPEKSGELGLKVLRRFIG